MVQVNRLHPYYFVAKQLPPNITLNEGSAMPCVNCIMMGFATNLVFTPSCLVDYLPHPRLECMQENQFLSIFIFIGTIVSMQLKS
jgi:hypothetical protein